MVRSQPGTLDFRESLVDLLGHLDGAIAIAFVQQNSQFVAAQPSQQITRACHIADLIGNRPQEGIACLVPTHIVNVLELIEVEIEQRPVLRRTTGAGQRLLEFMLEMLSIHPTCEGIVLSQITDT
jgi:hypothetical protein